MLPTTISSYGGPYQDAGVVENSQTDFAAEKANRLMEDTAQMTNTAVRVIVSFAPAASDPVVVDHDSLWGSGEAQKPTIARGSAGIYVITWPDTMVDGLDEEEVLALRYAKSELDTDSNYRCNVSARTANTITVRCRDAAGTLSDLSSSELVTVWGY
jgi:hypothetical protein